MGVRVGSLAGTRKGVFLQHRDGVLVYGPTGSGKTALVAWHLVMGAPAACLVTTTKADLLASTWLHRSKIGPVGVFDPEGLTGWPNGVRWSPLAGCKDPDVAIRRAHAFAAAMPMEGTKNGDFFQRKAAVAVAVLSACGGGRWVFVAGCAYVGAVENDAGSAEHPRERDGYRWCRTGGWSSRRSSGRPRTRRMTCCRRRLTCLAPLASPRLMRALDCAPGDSFDPEEWIKNRGHPVSGEQGQHGVDGAVRVCVRCGGASRRGQVVADVRGEAARSACAGLCSTR